MRIRITRDSVIDKFNPLERSPKHKKLPKVLRSKTPEKARRADVISPRERKSSFVSPKPNKSVQKKKSKVRAINLLKLFDDSKDKKRKTEALTSPLPSPETPLDPEEGVEVVSLVSMKTEVLDDRMSTPPPVKIKRSWKKHLPFSPGYKLFSHDSPAKAAASPHSLAIKLCFLGRISDPPLIPPPKFEEEEELDAKAEMRTKRLNLQLIR